MLSLQQSGKGNPLVLIHGFCENNTCFNEQVLLLKDRFNVITVDLPGIGHSPFIAELSMEKCADALHRTLVHIGIEKSIIMGHSMGGYVTLAFAKKYPEMVSGFGLLHSTANADNDQRKAKRDQAIAFIGEHGAKKYVTNFIPPLFHPSYENTPRINELITEGVKADAVAVQAQLMAMKTRPASRDWLRSTDLAGLFVAGLHDTLIPAEDIIAQAAEMRCSSIEVLKHAAHMGMIEEPKIMCEAIIRFADNLL